MNQENLASRIDAALTRVKSGVSIEDIESAVRLPLSIDLQPSEVYALVAFLRHERRQKWVGYVVETRLQVRGLEMASMGAFARPQELSQKGDVPGEEGWSYFFHGRGCCFTHRDGTVIDVDFADDGSALDIDRYFYNSFLGGAPDLAWCERQLKYPAGLDDAWHFDLRGLAERNLIQLEWRFRLTEQGRTLAASLELLADAVDHYEGTERCFLLTAAGDFIAADDLAKRIGFRASILSERAITQKEQRIAVLKAALHGSDESDARFAMAALGTIGKQHAFTEVQLFVQRQPVTSLNHQALAALRVWNGSDVVQCLEEAFSQLTRVPFSSRLKGWFRRSTRANEAQSRWLIIVRIARALFEKVEPQEMSAALRYALADALSVDCTASDAEAGFLLYLLDRDAGREHLAAALSNATPGDRRGAACFLAMIGDDWSVDALVAAANGPPERGGHEAACALSLIDNNKARSEATQWLHRNDGYEEAEGMETDIGGRKVLTWRIEDIMRSDLREHSRYHYERTLKEFKPLLSRWRQM